MKINRIAVSIFFFVNGFLYANWTARLPELQRFFDVSHTGLGTLLLTSAGGAILAMPITGWLTTTFGSQKITAITGLLFCAMLPLLTASPVFSYLLMFFFLMGLTVGAMDVAMNGQAVLVERDWKKPIMSSFHALFSIGMALGAGAGALFANFEIELQSHFIAIAVFGFLANLWASRNLINDAVQVIKEKAESSHFQLPTKAILPLGIIAFCGMTGEGSMADWSALFMNKVVGQGEAFSALAFGAFATAMTIGRIFGDHFTEKLGYQKILLYDSLLAIFGLTIALAFVSVWSTLIGFFLVGLGLATVVPIVYSKAGNTPEVAPAVGIAMATTIGYSGFFVGPPAIGFIADNWDLRFGFGFTLILFILMMIFILKFIPTKK